MSLVLSACTGMASTPTLAPHQARGPAARSAESTLTRDSATPRKRKVRSAPSAVAPLDTPQEAERTTQAPLPASDAASALQPERAAPQLPAEFQGPQAEQLETAYFCLDRVPSRTTTQCFDDLKTCAEGREALGFQKLCEAVPVVHCFYVIGDMWLVPFCYRSDAACRRVRNGLREDFETTTCAHTVRSTLSSQKTEASQ